MAQNESAELVPEIPHLTSTVDKEETLDETNTASKETK